MFQTQAALHEFRLEDRLVFHSTYRIIHSVINFRPEPRPKVSPEVESRTKESIVEAEALIVPFTARIR